MARARNIKPGFFSNDKLAELSPLTRILFAGLWTIADRSGRLEDRPKKIKAEVLPYDNCNTDKMLDDLHASGFVIRYEIKGIKYIQVVSFERHQNPHKNEVASSIPAPERHSTSTVQEPAKDGTNHADSLFIDSLSTDSSKRASRSAVMPEGFDQKVWEDFQAIRKAKKAPLSETALSGISREATACGLTLESALRMCCERGWQSLKAEWVNKNNGANHAGSGKYNTIKANREALARELAKESLGDAVAPQVLPALPGEVH